MQPAAESVGDLLSIRLSVRPGLQQLGLRCRSTSRCQLGASTYQLVWVMDDRGWPLVSHSALEEPLPSHATQFHNRVAHVITSTLIHTVCSRKQNHCVCCLAFPAPALSSSHPWGSLRKLNVNLVLLRGVPAAGPTSARQDTQLQRCANSRQASGAPTQTAGSPAPRTDGVRAQHIHRAGAQEEGVRI
jgi:hypothetical protein